ncbi:DUF4145 domain-containing protein [Photobacterium aphoticum]|nr:DUF4145 domain-containing protein [Photobacterium aphoticum]
MSQIHTYTHSHTTHSSQGQRATAHNRCLQAQGNFHFLQPEMNDLYQQAIQAEKYLYADSQSSLAKMRLFVELACHELGRHFKLKPPVHGDLCNKINMLSTHGSVEVWVTDTMHRLREAGNRSVHLLEVNGHYVAQQQVSRGRMQALMVELHDLAKYVANKLLGVRDSELAEWCEPEQTEIAEWVTDALNGQQDASFALAEYCYAQLAALTETGDEKWWNKTLYADRQRDLAYWLEKAHAQGHPKTWLLLANSYASGKLMQTAERDAKLCFKRALETDCDGQAAYDYGVYLRNQQQSTLGWEMITQAAAKGHHEALMAMQEKTAGTADYSAWVQKGLTSEQLTAYTLDAFHKLETYINTPDASEEEKAILHKQLRSAVITGSAKRAPGMAFIQAYVDGHGLGNKLLTQPEMAEKMVASYDALPGCLSYHSLLFAVICSGEGHYDVLRKIYQRALSQSVGEDAQADVKFKMAQQAIAEFKLKKKVATPTKMHILLKEAADAGHKEARAYIHSAEGKALLKKSGYETAGRMRPKSAVQKAKDKKKRQSAKKARKQ